MVTNDYHAELIPIGTTYHAMTIIILNYPYNIYRDGVHFAHKGLIWPDKGKNRVFGCYGSCRIFERRDFFLNKKN